MNNALYNAGLDGRCISRVLSRFCARHGRILRTHFARTVACCAHDSIVGFVCFEWCCLDDDDDDDPHLSPSPAIRLVQFCLLRIALC